MSTTAPFSAESPKPTRILLVEDEPGLREVLARFLRRRGLEVETANDGIEGLAKLTNAGGIPAEPFELLVTDLNMPNMGGIELIHAVRIRQLDIKVIACSSAFTVESLDTLRKLSVDATLPKTSLYDSLMEEVGRVMRLKP